MFDQTKRKEMENKQISWEKAKNDQKKFFVKQVNPNCR